MSMVLVDSSVWIDYFKGKERATTLTRLIEYNQICTNDLILAELLPSIIQRKEQHLRELMSAITKIDIKINWQNLVAMQVQNLKNGINKVGIPDLIIAQNVIENNLKLFTFDDHFELMSRIHSFEIVQN